MRPYDPTQPVIFTHIPKCAGSSFIRLLKQWFGRTYLKLNQDETQDILLPRVELTDDQGRWLPGIKCVHGHFDHGRRYGLPYYYPEVQQYFTIFRDPFDIVVSMYFFCKGRSREGRFWYRGKQVNILDEYPTLESYLADYPYWLFNHLPQDITLSNYRQKLEQRFIYIGIQEDLANSIRRLAQIFDKSYIDLPKYNESVYDEHVPNWLREKFYRDYPLLKAIYDFAQERYLEDPDESPAAAGRSATAEGANGRPGASSTTPLGSDRPAGAIRGSGEPDSANHGTETGRGADGANPVREIPLNISASRPRPSAD